MSSNKLAITTGGVAVGKTTLRNLHSAGGYVSLDTGDIVFDVSQGHYSPFPGPLEEALVMIGNCVATHQAIAERRNIVMEPTGIDQAALHELIDTMERLCYSVSGQLVKCDDETARQGNLERGDNNISSYFAEPCHVRSLLGAARDAIAKRMA